MINGPLWEPLHQGQGDCRLGLGFKAWGKGIYQVIGNYWVAAKELHLSYHIICT